MLDDKTRLTVGCVKMYGILHFHNGKKNTIVDVAKEATHAISELSKKYVSLTTILTSSTLMDDSWESVTFEVQSRIGEMRYGNIVRRVKFKKEFGDLPDTLEYGPLIPMNKAERLLAILNE